MDANNTQIQNNKLQITQCCPTWDVNQQHLTDKIQPKPLLVLVAFNYFSNAKPIFITDFIQAIIIAIVEEVSTVSENPLLKSIKTIPQI